jgi:two-component sensor histidine kinase
LPDILADLGFLLDQALEFAGPNRIRVDPGPPVTLKRNQVGPLSLILHELATNAFKHGALSTAQGVVHLTWRVAIEDRGSALHLHWKEEGGPPVSPPSETSFGTRVIQFSASQSLGGAAELSYEPTGLQVHVTAPLQ